MAGRGESVPPKPRAAERTCWTPDEAAAFLRHTAASIMIAMGIPIAVVSKTLRHTTLAITINLYGHLLKDSADEAVKALSSALDHADAKRCNPTLIAGSDTGELPAAA
ncbi:tyrosine-type recombinase/integrase [Kitasatospora acidiphila]|uniref:Tyrosine-type recombinase/integrase n=1 Tax=Kitasatospora acidiphila TaxID=2567942 RepID=A0A540W1C2_9ACTN|nr:tyrosine-type recombinase/integrase [Kitasatospora acidiphila]TQF02820.1 tyrosine-type recombinase/integrase [Kitasatospora acidiphila]